MDEHRFDNLTRGLARSISRRGGLRLLASAGASLLALARGKGEAAAQEWFLSAGEPCRDSSQCRGADAPLVCADNGFPYDGPLNCCTYEGSRCGADEHCCGTAYCDANGLCSSTFDVRGVGDPCQTTDQCRRPQTGAICEYTVSTGDSRCCWYEGSLCTSGAQCCGSRVCAGGVCQFLGGGSSMGGCTPEGYGCDFDGECCGDLVCGNGICRALAGGSGIGSGAACTWEGCTCVLYRDPECRASCPLYDPCDPGLRCTGTSEDIGTCVPA
jgi:hypothetical protein